jgi:hypothetical protein
MCTWWLQDRPLRPTFQWTHGKETNKDRKAWREMEPTWAQSVEIDYRPGDEGGRSL